MALNELQRKKIREIQGYSFDKDSMAFWSALCERLYSSDIIVLSDRIYDFLDG